MILVDTLPKAKEVWNQVRKNPGGFAKLAQELSMDEDSRAIGGLLAQPIVRYAEPLHVSEAAFEQLVDGDPNDKDPTHKPQGRRLHRADPGQRDRLGRSSSASSVDPGQDGRPRRPEIVDQLAGHDLRGQGPGRDEDS